MKYRSYLVVTIRSRLVLHLINTHRSIKNLPDRCHWIAKRCIRFRGAKIKHSIESYMYQLDHLTDFFQ